MANEVEGAELELFKEEEVRGIGGLIRGKDYIEVTCGCTSGRYGDAVGRLRVFPNGNLLINCECTSVCCEERLTPTAFEKHCGKDNAKKWQNSIWVFLKDEKVRLSKTVLLKYYYQAAKRSTSSGQLSRKGVHRDEFILCSKCKKGRRFRLRNKIEYRKYHDASLDSNWKCSDHPNDRICCDDDEERSSRRAYRGCSRSASCRGCTHCVCSGCELCRFSDCSCHLCVDFTRNQSPDFAAL